MLSTLCRLLRPHFWLLSIIPAVGGVVIARGELRSRQSLAVAFVACALSCIAEIVNNFVDFETDQEQQLKRIGWLPLAGGSGLPSNPMGRSGVFVTTAILTLATIAATLALHYINLIFLVPAWLMAVGYSAPPLRLKERGVLGTADMVLSRGMLPFAFGWAAVASLTREALVIGAFLSLLNLGSATVPHLADFEDDSRLKIGTFPVRHGFRSAIRFAVVGILLSLFVLAGLRFSGMHLNLLVWILLACVLFLVAELWRLQSDQTVRIHRVQLLAMATFLLGPLVFL